jgi:hypothetical protein
MTTFVKIKCSKCGQLVIVLGSYFSPDGRGPSKALRTPINDSDLKPHECSDSKDAKKESP